MRWAPSTAIQGRSKQPRTPYLMKVAMRLAAITIGVLSIGGCAFWNPFDHDKYNAQADATLVVDNEEYRVSWIVPITRHSSLNPYSDTGRQDDWHFDWGGQTVVLHDGTTLWIDASKPIGAGQVNKLLGITGTQPVSRPPRSPDMLGPRHPIFIKVPVYTFPTNGRPLLPYRGNCASDRPGCLATVRISVPSNYVGPYDRNPANYLSEEGN